MMDKSQREEFDAAVLDAIEKGNSRLRDIKRVVFRQHPVMFAWLGNRGSVESRKENAIDRTLQRLRKRGKIQWHSQTGWRIP